MNDPTIIGYRSLPIPGAARIPVLHPVFQAATDFLAKDLDTYRGRKDLLRADDEELDLWAQTALDRAQEQLYELPEGQQEAFVRELVGVLRARREA